MFDNKTEVLNSMFAKGWKESSVVLVSCAYTKDVVCNISSDVIGVLSSANSGMIAIEPLYTHKNRSGYYTYNKYLNHRADGCGYNAGLLRVRGWLTESEAKNLFTSEDC